MYKFLLCGDVGANAVSLTCQITYVVRRDFSPNSWDSH